MYVADMHVAIGNISQHCTDMGCDMYPPIDTDALQKQRNGVLSSLAEMNRLAQLWVHILDTGDREAVKQVEEKLQHQLSVSGVH